MPFSKAGQLARTVPTARLSDPIGLVAENLRESPHGVLPVLDRTTYGDQSDRNARVVGLITQDDLSKAVDYLVTSGISQVVAPTRTLVDSENGTLRSPYASLVKTESTTEISQLEAISPLEPAISPLENSLRYHHNGSAPKTFDTLRANDVMRGDVPFIPAVFSLHNALLTLNRYDLPSLPVIDEAGRYVGLVSRADIVSAIAGTIRPPLVGGMATPLGVYLTDGRLSGGVSAFALFLSGLTLAFCLFFSEVLLGLGAMLINPQWGAMAFSGRIGLVSSTDSSLFNTVATVVHGLLFLGMMRILPIAGFHAAEHQTVHALERGLPLEIEYVEKMPRAHPRCGTNLMAIASLMLIGFQHLPDIGPEYIAPILIFTFFFWRSFGTFLQEYFTTRPASKKELQSGIDAAKQLMTKYQAQPFASPSMPLRLLNGGMLPSAIGMTLGLFVLQDGLQYLARFIIR